MGKLANDDDGSKIKTAMIETCNLFTLKKEIITCTHEYSNTYLSMHFHNLQNNRTKIFK